MYSTVVSRHPTVIKHPIPQPMNIGVNHNTARQFAVDPAQTLADARADNLKGAYSIPVQIRSGAIKDPTLSGYETPSFISKKEEKIKSSTEELAVVDPAQYLKVSMEKDIGTFLAQFDTAKDKAERIQACKQFSDIYKF